MKNCLLSILLLAAAAPVTAQQLAPVMDACDIDVTTCRPHAGFWASADVLYWSPHMRGFDFAVTEDGTAATLGTGSTHEVSFDRTAGFRTQVGYVTQTAWSIDFGYTHFATDGENSVSRPPGVGQLFATYSHPGGPEEAETAAATATFDFDTFDIVARHPIVNRQFIGIDLFGGVRWARINHSIAADYNGRDFIAGVVRDEFDINAFGFRVGGDTHWRMAHGCSLFGRAAVAALYGQIKNQRLETNLNGNQLRVRIDDSYEQPIFNIDTALGLAWTSRWLQLSSGYEFNAWTNTSDRLRFVDDIEEAGFASVSGDILLEGFFFRVGATW